MALDMIFFSFQKYCSSELCNDACRNLELLKLNLLNMTSSIRFIRHLACASQLL